MPRPSTRQSSSRCSSAGDSSSRRRPPSKAAGCRDPAAGSPSREDVVHRGHLLDVATSDLPGLLDDPGERAVLPRRLVLDLHQHLLGEVQRLFAVIRARHHASSRVSGSAGSPVTSFTAGKALMRSRAMRHACCTTQESERSCLVASSWISRSISSGKYKLCLRLSVPAISWVLPGSGQTSTSDACPQPGPTCSEGESPPRRRIGQSFGAVPKKRPPRFQRRNRGARERRGSRDDSLRPPWAQRGRGGTPRPNTHPFSKIRTRGVARPFLTLVASATD